MRSPLAGGGRTSSCVMSTSVLDEAPAVRVDTAQQAERAARVEDARNLLREFQGVDMVSETLAVRSLLALAAEANWPTVHYGNGLRLLDESSWKRTLPTLLRHDLLRVSDELAGAILEHERRQRWEREDTEREAARTAPDPDADRLAAERAERLAEMAERESPAGLQKRTVELLEQILQKLPQ